MKPRNSMANGRKDIPIAQMHMPGFTKPLKYAKATIPPIVTLEDDALQPKEETPWTSTQP
jgi:hypothetical protein